MEIEIIFNVEHKYLLIFDDRVIFRSFFKHLKSAD